MGAIEVARQRTWVVAQPDPPLTKPTYLVDGACGFCMRSMAKVLARFPNTFEAIPYQDAHPERFGLTVEECARLGHFLKPDGTLIRISSGSGSWAGILAEQSRGWQVLAELMQHQPVKFVADAVYSLVAKNRGRLSAVMPRSSR